MINNEIGRDERVHLNEHDIIANESATATEPGVTHMRPWPQTKSDSLLQDAQAQDEKPSKSLCNKIQGAIFPMIVLGIILGLVVMLFIINNSGSPDVIPYTCNASCSVSLVESIPENLTYAAGAPSHDSTYSVWKDLITSANKSLYISSMYWTLRNEETGTSAESASEGEDIFTLLQAAIHRGVDVKIVASEGFNLPTEIDILAEMGAEVRSLNFTAMFGSGVLHTKFIISDMQGFYLGSANMDWRSLTQVKEMGVHVSQCSCPIVEDLYKIFETYWALVNSTIPTPWPKELDTHYNINDSLNMNVGDNETAHVFLSSSPAELCTESRTKDLDAILTIMKDAKKYVYIAVMDYFPTTLYLKAPKKNIYWPDIDDTIRRIVFEDNVEVRLLASYWNHTEPVMLNYLRSLNETSDKLKVKVFIVPTYGEEEAQIPFSRVNHNKYMVTDRVAYIGTSNWSGDYFLTTAGVAMIFNQSDASTETMTIRQQLTDVFLRDWESPYSHSVDDESLYIREETTDC